MADQSTNYLTGFEFQQNLVKAKGIPKCLFIYFMKIWQRSIYHVKAYCNLQNETKQNKTKLVLSRYVTMRGQIFRRKNSSKLTLG